MLDFMPLFFTLCIYYIVCVYVKMKLYTYIYIYPHIYIYTYYVLIYMPCTQFSLPSVSHLCEKPTCRSTPAQQLISATWRFSCLKANRNHAFGKHREFADVKYLMLHDCWTWNKAMLDILRDDSSYEFHLKISQYHHKQTHPFHHESTIVQVGMVDENQSPLPGPEPRRGTTSCKGCVGLGRLGALRMDVHLT